MSIINIHNVLNLLNDAVNQKYSQTLEVNTENTEDEIRLFDYILDIIDHAMISIQFDFEDHSTLDKDEYDPINDQYNIKGTTLLYIQHHFVFP